MLTIEPTGKILGATVRGVDLRQDLSRADFAAVLRALGEHGVLCFPDQALEAPDLKRFSNRFGDIRSGAGTSGVKSSDVRITPRKSHEPIF